MTLNGDECIHIVLCIEHSVRRTEQPVHHKVPHRVRPTRLRAHRTLHHAHRTVKFFCLLQYAFDAVQFDMTLIKH